jgi:hypothetical protein
MLYVTHFTDPTLEPRIGANILCTIMRTVHTNTMYRALYCMYTVLTIIYIIVQPNADYTYVNARH